ncbi:MAG: hypothetical protein LBP36_00145 [Oscillospiraceae bacterium]|nr:hypothetical protein [Oscillospiraceae bacterium]
MSMWSCLEKAKDSLEALQAQLNENNDSCQQNLLDSVKDALKYINFAMFAMVEEPCCNGHDYIRRTQVSATNFMYFRRFNWR